MSEAQRIIKYCAIAFAIFLIVSIISIIMFGITMIGKAFTGGDNVNSNLKEISGITNFSALNVDVATSNITIKDGSKFKILTDNKYIKSKQDGNSLYISEKNRNIFDFKNDSELIIYIPTKFVLDDVYIDGNVGKLNIANLTTRKIDLDLGAGKVSIDGLNVLDKASIDGGIGETVFKNSSINNLNMDVGVGKLVLTAKLTGNNIIDGGVGECKFNLIGTLEDYKVKVTNGIGNIRFDGKTVSDDATYGNGDTLIDFEGGVGSTKFNFEEDN